MATSNTSSFPKRTLILLILCAGCLMVGLLWSAGASPAPTQPVPESSAPSVPPTTESEPLPTEPTETMPQIELPAEFLQMQEKYPDIFAWIQYPEAEIDYPVVQRFGNDDFYLRRDLDGKYSTGGSLFSEYRYNGIDFEDPVTIIYGHNMRNGTMFGKLQKTASSANLEEGVYFTIYQEGRRLTYRIFAAVPFDKAHVLYYNNFRQERDFNRFFEEVFSIRSLAANLDKTCIPVFGQDKVVILSTCLQGNKSQRFLVMGLEVEDVQQALS